MNRLFSEQQRTTLSMKDVAKPGRDIIMKMPLSSGPGTSSTVVSSRLPSPIGESFDENPNRLTTYLQQLAGCNELEVDCIVKDHCYSRPWNWKPENVYVKPMKKLFFVKNQNTLSTEKEKDDEEVEIEKDIGEPQAPPYDLTKSRHLMDEFQRLANFARPEESDDWEEKIEKTLWSPVQNRIFTKVVRILTSERLARLAKANSLMEPIFRRTSVDTAARRFRETLASAGWDWRVTQWLHSLLFDRLPQEYLAIYLDILQTLRLKIPQLVDKMIAVQPNINAKGGPITWETLGSLLKRSWDPIGPALSANRPKKLPGNPILIVAPSGIGSSVSSRQHKWISQLGSLGMVVNVHTHLGLAANRMTMMTCIDQLVQATRAKIQDVRGDCPGRPIILIGFNTGAALACQVAQLEHVTAVICLGFPFLTVDGKRGTPDDTLMDMRCPVMFVIGQNATQVRTDDLEELREKMQVETSLVVIGTADDHLRITTAKKISDGITQSMVDRCILDEIGDFVGSILLQPHPMPLRPTAVSNFDNKTTKKEVRKRKNSTSSSVESEPNSPNVKRSRPGTPVASTTSTGATTTSISKAGTMATQSSLVSINGPHVNHGNQPKRKNRLINSHKASFSEHLITSRIPGQTNAGNGGITLNIGSLASLSPIGPIRLAPAPASQLTSSTVKSNGISRSQATLSKVSKLVSTEVSPQSSTSKMKTIVPGSKGFAKMTSSGYKHVNITDKVGETKLVNVLTTGGSQVRVGLQSKPPGNASGTFSTLIQRGICTNRLVSGASPGRPGTASSILLTPNNSTTNTVTSGASATTTKVLDTVDTDNTMPDRPSTIQSLDASKLPLHQFVQHISQGALSTSSKSHSEVSCSNIVVLADSSRNPRSNISSLMPPSQTPITILPLSSKLRTSQKPTKSMPKITMNNSSLQRTKPQSPPKRKPSTDLDDDLGNILDIPIIFAKDGENLSSIERAPPSLMQAPPPPLETFEKSLPKVGTKLVLISNKQDKVQQQFPRLQNPIAQSIVRPSGSSQPSHVILQTRPQNPVISSVSRGNIPIQTAPRTSQPTIKYTKIILAKRNTVRTSYQGDRSEHVVLTKTSQRLCPPKVLGQDKSEHRYAQVVPSRVQDYLPDDSIEIEDAIKKNIIERKIVSIPEIDLTSPKKGVGEESASKVDGVDDGSGDANNPQLGRCLESSDV
ncbi:KAT8 regulatory NSL complex subunit 3 isoform X2 [Orussus abietinus]|uniref:KAT8 regulatory NSL complex subunit 3 isoform X2 n=1 Tax=Orussus abietinus TaxID=222816 RepID=UPI000626C231|nr:KAT8 regulatory NSL complex subunit 3 isoform X2 [Orussus abietinus]